MLKPANSSDAGLRRELLAAYADGELDALPALKKQVAAWLAGDLEVQAELESLHHYREWWQATVPADPGVKTWSALLARLQRRLGPVLADNEQKSRRRRLLRLAGLAAAVVACVWLGGSWWFTGPTGQRPELAAVSPGGGAAAEPELLPVAAAAEVEILSVAGADTPTLVIGEPPVRGPLELLAAGEATLAEGDSAAPNPEIRMRGPRRPMIWARLASEENDE